MTPPDPGLVAQLNLIAASLSASGLLANATGPCVALTLDPAVPTAIPEFAPSATAAQQQAVNAVIAGWAWPTTASATTAGIDAANQAAAAAAFGVPAADYLLVRAVALAALDAVNALRARLTAQDAAVKNATSLAALQSAWAALAAAAPMAALTDAQAKAAVLTRVNNGTAD
jgi:hypothetical protein